MFSYLLWFASCETYLERGPIIDFFFFAVKLNAGRNVVGVLRGFDQFMNLVLDNTVEINGADKNEIGMVVRPLL